MTLKGKTMFISGASRGIGLSIAKRVAADGANNALVGKPAQPLRSDERKPDPRHLRGVAGLHPAHEGPGKPAHPDTLTADPTGIQVAAADRLHDDEVRNDVMRPRCC